MSSTSSTARQLTRSAIARAAAHKKVHEGTGAAVQAACEQVCRELTVWLGPAGSYALVTRAAAKARADHPLLDGIRIDDGAEPAIDVTAAIEAHGESAVTEALTDMLETMFDLLGRLIGDDLAARLMAHGLPDRTRGETPQ